MSDKQIKFKYRPDIDGLRTLAVVAVVLFHFGFGVPGGFIGVDIFFVISGYLITSIICKDLAKGDFSMARFWERRIRRIVPALVVVVTLVCIAGMFILYPGGMKPFAKEVIAQATLVSNFYFWQQDGYFAGAADSRPLLHTWSLAVEEQFYFIFPIFLVWVHKAKPRRIMKWVGWLLMASFLWSLYGVSEFPRASFFLLPARGWELLLGAMVALYKFKRGFSPLMNEVMSWVGIALMVAPMFFYDKFIPFPGLAALPPCLGAALIIFCNHQKMGSASRLLALPPVVFIGKISYSLYLWHWPIFVFFHYTAVGELSVELRLWMLVASFVLAILSWRFVETPFRGDALLPERKKVFRVFYAISAVYIIFGLVVYRGAKSSGGWPGRLSDDVVKISNVANDPGCFSAISFQLVETGKFPLLVVDKSQEKLKKTPVLVWGDSHAWAASPALHSLCKEYKMNVYGAVCAGFMPLFDAKLTNQKNLAEVNDKIFEIAEKYKIKDVIIASRWSVYPLGEPGDNNPLLIAEGGRTPKQQFEKLYKETIDKLRAKGMRIWVMKQVPLQRYHVPYTMANALRFGRKLSDYDFQEMSTTKKEHEERQRFVNSVIDKYAGDGVHVLDPTPFLPIKDGHYLMEIDGAPLYRDDDHVSVLGADTMKSVFKPMFETFKKDYLEKQK